MDYKIMFDKLKNRPELAAYFGVITVSIILGVFIGKTYLVGARSAPVTPLVGTKLQLADVDWTRSKRTLVLAFRTGCPYCSESTEFYRRLSEQCRLNHVRLIAVAPDPVSESQKYLNEAGVSVDDLRQSELPRLGIMRTPTLVLVDDGGIVSRIWLGELSSSNEQDVIQRVAGDSAGS